MSAFANPYLIPELIMNPVPEPGEPPKTKVMVHGLRCKSAVCGLNGHRLCHIISLFKGTYEATIQI